MKKYIFLFLILFSSCKTLQITTETETVFKDTTITIFDTVKVKNVVPIFDTNIIETEKFIYKSYIDTSYKINQLVSTVQQKPFEVTMKIEHKHTLVTKEKIKKKLGKFQFIIIGIIIILVLIIILKLLTKILK